MMVNIYSGRVHDRIEEKEMWYGQSERWDAENLLNDRMKS